MAKDHLSTAANLLTLGAAAIGIFALSNHDAPVSEPGPMRLGSPNPLTSKTAAGAEDCGCGCADGTIDKWAIVNAITCAACKAYAWASTMCPKLAGVTWHHPACPIVTPRQDLTGETFMASHIAGNAFAQGQLGPEFDEISVGDCDWTHPWDCVTSAWDDIKKIPGIGALADKLEDFSNTPVGKAFFAIVSPSILGGLATNLLPGVGQSLVVALANPVVLNALPGLARGERVDQAFIASAKMVAKRIMSSGGGGEAAADAMQPLLDKAMPYVTTALSAAGTSPAALEAYNTSLRIQAGLRTAEQELPPDLQAQLDAKLASVMSKIDTHALAERAGVPDDVMQLAIFGATRAKRADPALHVFDAHGNLPSTVPGPAPPPAPPAPRITPEQRAADLLFQYVRWRGTTDTPEEIESYFRAHPNELSPEALAVLSVQNVREAMVRHGMHPIVRSSNAIFHNQALIDALDPAYAAAHPHDPPPALVPHLAEILHAFSKDFSHFTRDQWVAYYLGGQS